MTLPPDMATLLYDSADSSIGRLERKCGSASPDMEACNATPIALGIKVSPLSQPMLFHHVIPVFTGFRQAR